MSNVLYKYMKMFILQVVKGVDFSEDETFSQVCNWLTKAVTDGIQKLYP